jgi:hypothetical protein
MHSAQGHTHLGVLLMCLVAMSCCLDSVLCPVAQVVALYKATHLVGEPPFWWCACASLGASARMRCSGAYGLMAALWWDSKTRPWFRVWVGTYSPKPYS